MRLPNLLNKSNMKITSPENNNNWNKLTVELATTHYLNELLLHDPQKCEVHPEITLSLPPN